MIALIAFMAIFRVVLPATGSVLSGSRITSESMAKPLDTEILRSLRQARNPGSGYHIVIRKSLFQLSLYKDGTLVKQYPVAVGQTPTDKEKFGDRATPEGWFNVAYINKAGTWTHDYQDGKGEVKGAYGPWFIAVSTTADKTFSSKGWTGIGIHGTNRPDSIGKNISGGCIRMRNQDVMELKAELDNEPDVTKIPVDIIP